MTERIRKLAKLYEENSYQIMKEDFEEQWKTASDWSKEERIAVALFVIRLMIVKKDFAAAEKYFIDYFTEDEDFSKYKEIIDKNKAEIAKQYEDSDKSVEEKKGEYACVYLDYTRPFGKSYYCHKKDNFCNGFTISCDGYETWKKGSEIKNKEEKAPAVDCYHYRDRFDDDGWCVKFGENCRGYADCEWQHEKEKSCKYYKNKHDGWCSFSDRECRGYADCQLPYKEK